MVKLMVKCKNGSTEVHFTCKVNTALPKMVRKRRSAATNSLLEQWRAFLSGASAGNMCVEQSEGRAGGRVVDVLSGRQLKVCKPELGRSADGWG